TRYSPVRHCWVTPAVRLACVKHAASVRSEPGSNSQVHHVPPHGRTKRTNPASLNQAPRSLAWTARNQPHKRNCNASKETSRQHPDKHQNQLRQSSWSNPVNNQIQCPDRSPHSRVENAGAPPTYPFHRICNCQRTPGNPDRVKPGFVAGGALYAPARGVSTRLRSSRQFFRNPFNPLKRHH